ncbi:integrase, catalytic region, zinc finger, CCHC-type containing protein [Tanacetum coccineum]|uniref:Integrase, catalytic region, zinc finger, CCHC-type containing protein n=1 Tax=Tanacetum coccineum TaxID=301880 RepID=A0ABQ5ESL5_9ASTR
MDSQYFKDKALLMEAKEKGDVLDAEAEAFLADVECTHLMIKPSGTNYKQNMFKPIMREMHMIQTWMKAPMLLSAFMANLRCTRQEHLDSMLRMRLMTIRSVSSVSFVHRAEIFQLRKLVRRTGVLVPANEIASQASKPATPATPFVHKSRPPSQVLANLQKVNAFVEQQLVPFYDHFKKHIQAANDTLFKEVKEYEQIFDDLEAEYERCILDNKNLTIEKKNLLIKNDCLIAECLEKDICSIVLTSDIVVPPSSNCLCEDLRSACDREHTKVLELEAEVLKQQKMVIESEKRNSHLQKTHIDLQLKFQNYKQCIDTSSASNAIFEINKLRKQLQGKDDTIRNLDAQINIMKVLNVGSTEGSCDQQALETDRIQLKDTITSLRIQLDGLKVENVSLQRRYDELLKANTHSRTAYTEKLSALTSENTKLKAQVTGKTSSGTLTSETPKVLAPGMYNLGSKYIPPPKRANWSKPTPIPKKQARVKPTSGASKTMPKRTPRNHCSLLAKSTNARRVDAYHRTLNKKNHVDSNLLVKHSIFFLVVQLVLWMICCTSLEDGSWLTKATLQAKSWYGTSVCVRFADQSEGVDPVRLIDVDLGRAREGIQSSDGPQRAPLMQLFRFVRTDNGTEFVNKTLDGWFESVVFGSLCYPTNDYDDVGKLKAKADIGIFVGYAPTKKAYRIYNKRTRKIQETVHVTFDELTEGLTSVQTSSGLAPQQMTSVPNSTELELTALQSGRSRSALVKDPEPPSVPPTKKQVDDLFQWFDDDEVIPPPAVPIPLVNTHAAQAPENAIGSPSTTVISEGAPVVTESLLPHQKYH